MTYPSPTTNSLGIIKTPMEQSLYPEGQKIRIQKERRTFLKYACFYFGGVIMGWIAHVMWVSS